MQPLSCEVSLMRVEDSLALGTAGGIRRQLATLLDRPGHVVLDLRDVTLDSAGLGAVLSVQRSLELRGRRLFLVSSDPKLLGLLDRVGVTGTVTLFADAGEAVNHVLAAPSPGSVA